MTIASRAVKKGIELLSEEGKQVLELKKVLAQNQQNPLIFNGLIASIQEKDYQKKIYDALVDTKCNEATFERLLLTVNVYTNREVMKKHFDDFQKRLSRILERTGQKHFSTSTNLSKGGVEVIKKVGINLDFIRREFLVTEREAKKLQKNGFVEAYAKLKVNAIVKHMIDKVEKTCGKSPLVSFELSDFYFDESSNFYNVDFTALISVNQEIPDSTVRDLAKYLDMVLSVIEKEYHRAFNG